MDHENNIEENLDEYSEWLEKNIPIHEDWIDEINYMSFLRNEIHNQVSGVAIENDLLEKIKDLDEKWKDQISKSIVKGFQYTDKPQEDYPKSMWWWHIDHLEDLSSDERSTL